MLINIIKQFNWVDIFVLIVFLRTVYVALKNGFPSELFRISGTIFSIYTALHYYTVLSDFTGERVNLSIVPLDFLDFLFFVFLVIIGDLIFLLSRVTFGSSIKMEATPRLNKIGGLILGALRAYLLAGLIVFMLVISSVSYFKNSAVNSYSGKTLFKVAPSTYSWLWHRVMSKFMTKEKFNNTILEVQESI